MLSLKTEIYTVSTSGYFKGMNRLPLGANSDMESCNVCFPMTRAQISPCIDTAFFSFQVARQPTRPRNSFDEDVSKVKFTKVDRILFVSEEAEAQTSAARPVEKDLETKQSKQCFSAHLIIQPAVITFFAAIAKQGRQLIRMKGSITQNNGWIM